MAKKDGSALDEIHVTVGDEGPRHVYPHGWWPGPAPSSRDLNYWRNRATSAEERCRMLARELDAIRCGK